MNSESISARDQELRSALVSTATLSRYSHLRVSPKVMIASITAFAIVGAVTGGAVAAAATRVSSSSAATSDVQVETILLAKQVDATLVGEPVTGSANGSLRIDLGAKPKGATGYVLGSTCIAPGNYTQTVNGGDLGGGSCSRNGSSPASEIDPVKDDKQYVVQFSAAPSAQLTAWASWISEPTIRPSAAQQAEIATGVVTRADYLAAFNRYAGCMAAAGYPLGAVDESSTVLNMMVPGAAVDSGVDNRCYVSEWQKVDELWQLQNWRTSTSVVMMQQCLTDQGIKPDLSSEQSLWSQVLANPAAKKCMGVPN
jgi:hypothetical protein